MDDEELSRVFNTFADLVERMKTLPAPPCELEGHFDRKGPLSLMHDQEGVKYREWFFCPTCGNDESLLVCATAHEKIMQWAEEETYKPNFFYCAPCGTDWEFMDVYNGGFAWG